MASYKHLATTHDLRQRIFTCIDKLSDRATFSTASSELDHLAKTLPSDSLPTFLSCILSLDSSSKSPVRVHCITLLSLLSHTHNHSLSPHLPKITSFILRRLSDGEWAVRAACAAAVSSLAPLHFTSLLDPLLGLVSTGQDPNAQIGSCLCLKAAVDAAEIDGGDAAADLRKRVLPKMVELVRGEGFKAKGALLGVIASVVGVVMNGRGGNLVGSVVDCAVEMLSSEDWVARKAAAEVLQKVAVVAEGEFTAEVKRFVVSSLESRRFDKVISWCCITTVGLVLYMYQK